MKKAWIYFLDML